MLELIITAALLITGLFAPKEHISQSTVAPQEVCVEVKLESQETNSSRPQKAHLQLENENLKKENERETI